MKISGQRCHIGTLTKLNQEKLSQNLIYDNICQWRLAESDKSH